VCVLVSHLLQGGPIVKFRAPPGEEAARSSSRSKFGGGGGRAGGAKANGGFKGRKGHGTQQKGVNKGAW
jgi:hypothetical protein